MVAKGSTSPVRYVQATPALKLTIAESLITRLINRECWVEAIKGKSNSGESSPPIPFLLNVFRNTDGILRECSVAKLVFSIAFQETLSPALGKSGKRKAEELNSILSLIPILRGWNTPHSHLPLFIVLAVRCPPEMMLFWACVPDMIRAKAAKIVKRLCIMRWMIKVKWSEFILLVREILRLRQHDLTVLMHPYGWYRSLLPTGYWWTGNPAFCPRYVSDGLCV